MDFSRMQALRDDIRLNVTVVSDTHQDVKHPMPALPQARFINVLKEDKASLTPVDVLEITGDTTSRGMRHNWDLFRACFTPEVAGYAGELLLQFGNHDTWSDISFESAVGEYKDVVREMCGYAPENLYFTRVVKGYHLVAMGSEGENGCEAVISDAQLAWLDGELAKATADGLPVFVFNHQALCTTHGLPVTNDADETYRDEYDGSVGRSSAAIQAVLEKYKNVFFFSGHSHMGLAGAKTLAERGYASFEVHNGVTYVMTPSLACGNHHGEDNSFDIGFQLEVYDERVVIRPRSFGMHAWCEVPITDGKPYFEAQIVK